VVKASLARRLPQVLQNGVHYLPFGNRRRVSNMSSRKLWPVALTFLLTSLSLGLSTRRDLRVSNAMPLVERESQLWKISIHNSEFSDVPHTTARARCERTLPPEALTTPNPIFGLVDSGIKVRVSFIVGADGRVHSPLILESAGSVEDHTILETVRSWRYRPATCNGVPTETEARIEFSTR
jgi:TonB family protein